MTFNNIINSDFWKKFNKFLHDGKDSCVRGGLEFFNFVKKSSQEVYAFVLKYAAEIMIGLYVTAAVAFLYLNVYVALTVGFFTLTYFVNRHIKNEQQKVDQEKNGAIKQEIKNVSGMNVHLLELFAHDVYDWVRDSDSESKSVLASRWLLQQNGYKPFKIIQAPAEDHMYLLYTEGTKDKNKDELVIVARGTDTERVDGTLSHDLDPDGPGYSVFKQHEAAILADVSRKVDGKKTITLAGHSFGGSVSMLLLWSLLKKVKAGELNIERINVSIYQTAGVNDGVADDVANILAELKTSKPNFKVNFVCHVHDFDLVPASGKQVLGDVARDNANVYMVRKHLSIWTYLLSVLVFDFSLPHGKHIYPDFEKKSALEQLAHNDSSIQYYSMKEEEHQPHIQKLFDATYTKFVCNGTIHRFLHAIGGKGLNTVKHAILFALTFVFFAANLVLFLLSPTLWRFGNCFAALGPMVVSAASFDKVCTKKFSGGESTGVPLFPAPTSP